MEIKKCRSCNKELTSDMEIEYSDFLNEFFCGPSCATDHYFSYMMSRPLDLKGDEALLERHDIAIVGGKLVVSD
ncbi:hypothetical protein HN020_09310 [Brevibacillus borstelensis]|uniref:hypothetical protein n=1 Tax=Brevibacillus borstelensis TaxID=45462 RepID=UPI00148FF483|nr:hypothetical protein [Brevibacillus borstelensis]NOU54945.1 hypothetical protein [Brevibacillus borstelensis]